MNPTVTDITINTCRIRFNYFVTFWANVDKIENPLNVEKTKKFKLHKPVAPENENLMLVLVCVDPCKSPVDFKWIQVNDYKLSSLYDVKFSDTPCKCNKHSLFFKLKTRNDLVQIMALSLKPFILCCNKHLNRLQWNVVWMRCCENAWLSSFRIAVSVYVCLLEHVFVWGGTSESVRVCGMTSKKLCHSSTCIVFQENVNANELVKTIMANCSLEMTFSYMRNYRICVMQVNVSCKSGRAFQVRPGFEPGLRLSKYFGPISGLHAKLVHNLRVTVFSYLMYICCVHRSDFCECSDCNFSLANSICKHSWVILFSNRISLTLFLRRRWQ